MEKTDRQTDSKTRGTTWSLTVFDPAEYGMLQAKDAWPLWVKGAKGQEEECPSTGKHHWQVALLTEQVRWSSIHKWLPTAHIELAKNKQALLQYVNKPETAVEGTKFNLENDKVHLALHQQLELFARCYLVAEDEIKKMIMDTTINPKDLDKKIYWYIANIILAGDPTQASMLANPALERMWVNTRGTWVELAREASKPGDA